MSDLTKRMIIAAAAAAVLIGGSVAALALTDDDDDGDSGRSLAAIAGELDEAIDLEDVVEELIDRIMSGTGSDDGPAGRLPDLLEQLFEQGLEDRPGTLSELFEGFLDDLGRDLAPAEPLVPPEAAPLDPGEAPPRPAPDPVPVPGHEDDAFGFEFGPRDRPFGRFFPFGGRFDGDGPFLLPDSDLRDLLREFFGDGRFTPNERGELRRLLPEGFDPRGFAFPLPDGGFFVPSDPGFAAPFGDLPLERFFADGRLTPDEARELQRLFEDRFPGGTFEFRVAPEPSDAPDALFDRLGELPLREFLEDGVLTPREQAALESALDRWLEQLFGRFGAPAP